MISFGAQILNRLDPILETYFGSPHQPELENVIMATALDDFVAGIVGDVIVFVLLEQVVGAHPVAMVQQTLHQAPINMTKSIYRILTMRYYTHVLLEVNCGTLEDDVHEFVRIPSHRVRPESIILSLEIYWNQPYIEYFIPLNSFEFVAELVRHQETTTPGSLKKKETLSENKSAIGERYKSYVDVEP